MMKTSVSWGKRVTWALLAGIACAVGAVFFMLLASHANIFLERTADIAAWPAALVERWTFSPEVNDVNYHIGRRFLVSVIVLSLYYAILVFLFFSRTEILSSAKSKWRRANGA